ncbi:MAG TPA: dTDP-4-dehydrorhamnose 3,5-epimerase [Gemmatimonadales bacterium]|nr:dTDP-4-dehydrorhamnose 3,5-epimerase [Gemmatimonadales bacterium]
MKLSAATVPDVLLIEPRVHADPRGSLFELWNAERFRDHGFDWTFVQDNVSRSGRGVLRGLHYQVAQAQGKLVTVLAGEIFDVAVDLRRASPTYGRWAGVVLAAERPRLMWIPPGFAHGFYVTSDAAEVFYKCTAPYAPAHERTIRWDDPDLAISWPLPRGMAPILSPKDGKGLDFREAPTLG